VFPNPEKNVDSGEVFRMGGVLVCVGGGAPGIALARLKRREAHGTIPMVWLVRQAKANENGTVFTLGVVMFHEQKRDEGKQTSHTHARTTTRQCSACHGASVARNRGRMFGGLHSNTWPG